MRRTAPLLALAALAAPLISLAADATAMPASEQGWWTTTNRSDTLGGVPAVPAPDVPADGLLLEGGTGSAAGATNGSPTAFAALVYDLVDGTTPARLRLTVAPGTATVPDATLELCPLTATTFSPAQGGPMSAAPGYDCHRNVTSSPDASTGAYDFAVSGLRTADALAVAVLPTSPTDRVVLSKPGSTSLSTSAAIPIVPVSTPPAARSTTAAVHTPPTTALGGPALAIAANPVAGGLAPLGPVPPAAAVAPVAEPAPVLAPPSAATLAPTTTDYAATPTITLARPRGARLLVGAGVALLAAGLWSAAGRLATRRIRQRAAASR